MQYSVVRYSDIFSVESDSRLDSEFYKPNFLESYRKLKSKPFTFIGSNNFYVTDGEHGSPDWDANSGIKYITAENIEKNLIKETDFANISEAQNTRNSRAILKETDVLIYSVGAYCGNAAKMERHLLPANIPRSVAIIRVQNNIFNPSYLSTILNTKYGVFQTERLKAGNAQPMLALEQIRRVAIPNLLKDFQLKISDICNNSYRLRMEAKSLYQKAENILLEELGLKDWKPKHQLSYVKNYSYTQQAERFDAEYFQPQYDAILNKISNLESSNLFDLLEGYSTGYPYQSENYLDEGIPLIRISNIKKGKLDLTTAAHLSEDYSNVSKKDIAREGNILISLSGTIGSSALVEKELGKCCVNQRILSIKVKPSIDKNYLCLLLNSVIGELQLNRIGAGGVQINISPKDVFNIQIPILKLEKQKEISLKIIDSKAKDKQSKSLLELAKKAVEMAIEGNEEKATKWIDQELEKLGVRLSSD